jgi:hypothetical protein
MDDKGGRVGREREGMREGRKREKVMRQRENIPT